MKAPSFAECPAEAAARSVFVADLRRNSIYPKHLLEMRPPLKVLYSACGHGARTNVSVGPREHASFHVDAAIDLALQAATMTTGAPLFERGPPLSEIQNSSIFAMDDISDEEMNSLIDGTVTDFNEGDLVTGTVVKVERDEVLLDISYKSEGVIPSRELSIRKDVNPADVVAMGDEIEALVLQKEDKEGRLVLSKKRAEYERAWNAVEAKFQSGETVEGEVIEVVKGGLILDIGLRGFLPASLVDLRRVKDLTAYMGTRIEARVIEMDRNRNNVVLSRRVVLEEARKAERQEILSKLQVGMRLKGTVSSIVDFGAFVDLGDGVEGLVHISEMAKSHVDQPSQVCTVGDTVQVKVMEIDLDRRRISLSMKAAAETLGTEVEVKPLPDSEKPAEAEEAAEAEAEETVEE